MLTILPYAGTVLATLILTSVYHLIETGLRKRVTVRSPEARQLAEIIPTVNMMVPVLKSLLLSNEAILEAVEQQYCNGNVSIAKEVSAKANKLFDDFLIETARVQA